MEYSVGIITSVIIVACILGLLQILKRHKAQVC